MPKKKNKEYGKSILYKPEPSVTPEDVNAFQYGEEEIDTEILESLKANRKRVKERVVIDALTGNKSSTIHGDKVYDSIHDIINEREIRGRNITIMGKSLLSDLLGYEMDEAQLKIITDVFKTIHDEKDVLALSNEEKINMLGTDVVTKLNSKLLNPQMLNTAIDSLLVQLYSSYMYDIQHIDDVKALSDVMKNLNSVLDTVSDKTDTKTLKETNKMLNDMMKQLSKVEKNSGDQNLYRITDVDIQLVAAIQAVLDRAVNYVSILESVDNNASKFYKDLKKTNKVMGKIETWVDDLKSDTETIYVMPVDTRKVMTHGIIKNEFIEHLSNTILMQYATAYDVDPGVVDIEGYLKEQGWLTDKDLTMFKNKAIAFTYVLSRTFKKSRIETDDDRRELSYTLDIVSKSLNIEYREDVCDIINIVWDKINK